MPASTDIYGSIQPPRPVNRLAQLAQVMQVQGLQQQGELGRMKMDEFRRGVEQDNVLSRAYQDAISPDGTIDRNKLLSAAASGGLGSKIPTLQKTFADQDKASADLANTKTTTEKNQFDMSIKRAEHAASVLGLAKDQQSYDMVRQILGNTFGEKAIAQMPPAFDPAYVEAEVAKGMTRVQQLTDQRAREGQAITVRGQDMTAATARRGQDITMRGQDLVDARTRETTAATMTKPFEVTGEDGKPVLVQQDKQGNIRPVQGYLPKQGASKPLTEGQAKAALFGSRMQAAEQIFDTLADKGVTTSIPGSRSGYGVGAVINAIQPGERQQLDQAKRDFINAVLRRESGAVISDQEFANAELQYFPQPGETLEQKAQKKANRELATRGILAEVPDAENRVAKIRGTAPAAGLKAGTVQDGYRFKGGDPSVQSNWEKV